MTQTINSVTDLRTWAGNTWGGPEGASDLALDRIARHAAWDSPVDYGRDWSEWLESLEAEMITTWANDDRWDHLIGDQR